MSGGLSHYRFSSKWKVPGTFDRVFDVLGRLETYPRWWPEVKKINVIDPSCAEACIRGMLPYSLRLRMFRELSDRGSGILKVRLSGDLDGYSCWTCKPEPDGCLLRFDQEVIVNKLLLRLLAPVGRPVFRLNHALMMFRGERGLRRYLNQSP